MEKKGGTMTRGGEWGVLWLKACPRCKGDMFLDRDVFGYYRECLQCGYLVDVGEGTQERPAAEALMKAS